jgi:hypothetical protein
MRTDNLNGSRIDPVEVRDHYTARYGAAALLRVDIYPDRSELTILADGPATAREVADNYLAAGWEEPRFSEIIVRMTRPKN